MKGKGEEMKGRGRKDSRLNERIFCVKKLFHELARKLNQDPIRPVIKVLEQVHRDVTITELKEH
jgi:hypothetical protein